MTCMVENLAHHDPSSIAWGEPEWTTHYHVASLSETHTIMWRAWVNTRDTIAWGEPHTIMWQAWVNHTLSCGEPEWTPVTQLHGVSLSEPHTIMWQAWVNHTLSCGEPEWTPHYHVASLSESHTIAWGEPEWATHYHVASLSEPHTSIYNGTDLNLDIVILDIKL